MKQAEILMATYNGAAFLTEQLDSILAQDTDSWHLTVSDDGSTDDTPQILEDYVRRFPEKITRVFSGCRFGNARDHFFWLMGQCKAEYMHFADQDDVWHPDKVRTMQEALEQAEAQYGPQTPLLVFTDQAVVDEGLQPIAPSLMRMQQQDPSNQDYRGLLFRNVVTGCTMAVNGALARLAEVCRDPAKTVMHDWWLGLIAARFGKLLYLDQATIDYRQHGGNSVGAQRVFGWKYVCSKIQDQAHLKESIRLKKAQALCFADTFADSLDPGETAQLWHFGAERGTLSFKLSYLEYISGVAWKLMFVVLW